MKVEKSDTMTSTEVKAVIDNLKALAMDPTRRTQVDSLDEMVREWADVLRERQDPDTEYYIRSRVSRRTERKNKSVLKKAEKLKML